MGKNFRYDQAFAELMINGQNVSQLLHSVNINYSLMHKIPGAYTRLGLLDTTGLVNKAKEALYDPMVPIRLIYSDGIRSNVREIEMVAAGVFGGKITEAGRAAAQNLMACTKSFFNAQSFIQHSTKGEPAGDVIKNIHSLFIDPDTDLRVVGTKVLAEKEHYLVSNRRAIDAVADIRKRAVTTDKYRSNSLFYFFNKLGYSLNSLEELLDLAMSPTVAISANGSDGHRKLGYDSQLAWNAIRFSVNQDNLPRYHKARVQAGGSPNQRLLDHHSAEYKPQSAVQYDTGGTYSSRLTSPIDTAGALPTMVHDPIYDGALTGPSPPNVDKAQAALQQAAAAGAPLARVNLMSLEPNLDIGMGVYLDAPAPAPNNPGPAGAASTKGHYLIINMGHIITMGASRPTVVNSFEAIQTGRQA